MTTNKRIGYIDGAKAIGILLVIIGHGYCLMHSRGHSVPVNAVRHVIYSFHMPMFFLIAGFFSRPMTLRASVPKYARAYLRPTVITSVIILLIILADSALRGKGLDIMAGQVRRWTELVFSGFKTYWSTYAVSEPYMGPLWFLLALFGGRVMHSYLLLKFSQWESALISVGLFVVAWVPTLYWPRFPLCIQAACMSVPFLHAGYLFRQHDLERTFRSMHPLAHVASVAVWLSCVGSDFNFKGLLFPLNLLHVAGGAVPTMYILWACDKVRFGGGIAGRSTLCILCGHTVALQLEKYMYAVCTCTGSFFANFVLESLLLIALTAAVSWVLYATRLVRS